MCDIYYYIKFICNVLCKHDSHVGAGRGRGRWVKWRVSADVLDDFSAS